jgi:hypothetical protein
VQFLLQFFDFNFVLIVLHCESLAWWAMIIERAVDLVKRVISGRRAFAAASNSSFGYRSVQVSLPVVALIISKNGGGSGGTSSGSWVSWAISSESVSSSMSIALESSCIVCSVGSVCGVTRGEFATGPCGVTRGEFDIGSCDCGVTRGEFATGICGVTLGEFAVGPCACGVTRGEFATGTCVSNVSCALSNSASSLSFVVSCFCNFASARWRRLVCALVIAVSLATVKVDSWIGHGVFAIGGGVVSSLCFAQVQVTWLTYCARIPRSVGIRLGS